MNVIGAIKLWHNVKKLSEEKMQYPNRLIICNEKYTLINELM